MRHELMNTFARPMPLERKDANPTGVTPEVKKLFEDIQNGFTAYRAKQEEINAELKARGTTDVVTKSEFTKLDDHLTKLQKQMDGWVIEQKRPSVKEADGTTREMTTEEVEHKATFNKWFRSGRDEHKLLEIEQKSLSVGSNPDGGYTVPFQLEQNIGRIVTDISPIRSVAQIISISTAEYRKPMNLTGANSGWVGETGSRPQTNTPQLAMMTFPAHELYAMPAATQTLLDDSSVNIDQWLADEVRIEFARAEGAAFVNGDGVAKPRGFMQYPVVADASYAWGSIGYIATGASGFAADPDGGDDLIDVTYALKSDYRNSAQWCMSRKTLGAIRQMQDSQGRYIWQPSLILGQPQSLLGYPIFESEDMPAVGNNNFPIAFADWRSAYLIVDRIGIRVLRDPFTAKPYVLFYTTKRVGGGVQNYEAIKLLKTASS